MSGRLDSAHFTLGNQRLKRFAIGTAQFGLPYGISNQIGQVPRSEVKLMLQLALASGIDTLDTAISYGNSETCLGEVGTQDFKVVSKLPPLPDSCADVCTWVKHQVSASLSRLGVTELYGLLLHCPEQLLGPNGPALYQALKTLKANGQVQKVGISIYSPSELVALSPKYNFDLVQAPFNLVDQRFYTSGWMQRLKDTDVEIHTRSAFLQGLLLMAQTDIPPKFLPWADLWQKWHHWLACSHGSAVQACLAFPLSFPEIDRIVVGAESVSQLTQIVSAINSKLKSDLPNLQSDDENLIYPVNWNQL
jgi:aryl-alcohol dehydrogenase-like predicted oxidoreductase